jgi:predicted membrane protein
MFTAIIVLFFVCPLFVFYGIYAIILLLTPAKKKEETKREYIIVKTEESDVDRQNREYGDYYGDSYYF